MIHFFIQVHSNVYFFVMRIPQMNSILDQITPLKNLTDLTIAIIPVWNPENYQQENPPIFPTVRHLQVYVKLGHGFLGYDVTLLERIVRNLASRFPGVQEVVVISECIVSLNLEMATAIWRRHFAAVPKLTVCEVKDAIRRSLGSRYKTCVCKFPPHPACACFQ